MKHIEIQYVFQHEIDILLLHVQLCLLNKMLFSNLHFCKRFNRFWNFRNKQLNVSNLTLCLWRKNDMGINLF